MNKKILLIGFIIAIVAGTYYYFLFPKTTKTSFNAASINILAVTLRSGNTIITESSDDTITFKTEYTTNRPVINIRDDKLEFTGTSIRSLEISVPKKSFSLFQLNNGAGNLLVNSKNVNVNSVQINIGAGNIDYLFPTKQSSTIAVSVGAGNVTTLVPADLPGLKLNLPPNTEVILNDNFIHTDTGYESIGFTEAPVKTEFTLNANSATFSIRSVEASN